MVVPCYCSYFAPNQSEITFADTYHGKVIPIETAKQLVSIKENLQISYPEKVIPYKIARDLILENPDHIVALDCPCRLSRSNPCHPLDVCLIIGEPFSRLVLDHHPHHSRSISPDEAIGILEAEEERGHVHHAFFKQAMIGRFYAICNCCSCCCGAIQAHKSGVPMLAKSGYISQIDKMICIECGECQKNCQFSSIVIKADGYFIDQDLCMGCGICMSHCTQGAIQMVKTSENLEPLALYYQPS